MYHFLVSVQCFDAFCLKYRINVRHEVFNQSQSLTINPDPKGLNFTAAVRATTKPYGHKLLESFIIVVKTLLKLPLSEVDFFLIVY